ncbi:MAG TPA: membrane protein insertion efficiency factor YidD [Acidimicrobiia bacterium]
MSAPEGRRASRPARALDACIVFYQRASANRLPRCRYFPTCSQYAREAVATHGAATGSWLALRRLGRCHPLGGHGYDPVPEPSADRVSRPDPSTPHPAHPLRGADPC